MSHWAFEVYTDAARQYRWRLKSANGRIVADSGEGYSSHFNAVHAAERARTEISGATIR